MNSSGVPKLIVKRFRSWPRLKLPKEIIAEQRAKQPSTRRRSTTRRALMIRRARTALRLHAYLIAVGLCAGVVAYGIVSAVTKSTQPNAQMEAMIKPCGETREPKPLVQPGDKREKSCGDPGRKKQTGYRTIKKGNLVLHVPKEKEKLTPALSSYELDQRREKGKEPEKRNEKVGRR